MARQKQPSPMKRTPSDFSHEPPDYLSESKIANGHGQNGSLTHSNGKPKEIATPAEQETAGLAQLIICVGGIYASLYSFSLALPQY